MRERLGLVTATLAEDIAGMRVVQACTREEVNQRQFEDVNTNYRAANQQTVVLNGIYFRSSICCRRSRRAIVLGYGGYLVFQERDDGGHAVRVHPLRVELTPSGTSPRTTFLAAVAALDKIMDVMEEEPEVRDRADAIALPAIANRSSTPCASRTARARRCYTGSSSTCPPGRPLRSSATRERASRRSRSSSPASTSRARRRDQDRRARHARGDPGVASAETGIVPQEGFLFAGNVRDNIARTAGRDVGRDRRRGPGGRRARLRDAPRERLRDRAQGARHPPLARASGLVAFARALLADPRILILDEATSSVDIGTERRIEKALHTLLADRTAFIIAHRLSTIRDADLIVVLEHGRVVEQERTTN